MVRTLSSAIGLLVLALTIFEGTKEVGAVPDYISCRTESGKLVDWYIAYKLNRNGASSNAHVRNGIGYVYLAPQRDTWRTSHLSMDDADTVVGKTIGFMFKEKKHPDLMWVAYNDQPPDQPHLPDQGHMKGMIIANKEGGVWLHHTVPKFANMTKNYYSYDNGRTLGNTFFCLTLSRREIDTAVATSLKVGKPLIYAHHFHSSFSSSYPNLRMTLPYPENSAEKARNYENQIVSVRAGNGGMNVTIFAKSPTARIDVYSDWIAPTLKTNLKVQTWLANSNLLPCTGKQCYTAMDVQKKNVGGFQNNNDLDHAKWAVGDNAWTCLSDMNRKSSHLKRGGATLCTPDSMIWENFRRTIISTLPCTNTCNQG